MLCKRRDNQDLLLLFFSIEKDFVKRKSLVNE